jgi:UDP-N-acetylmuramoyl-tripeptide--D-alanyl-D-alanine ligase
MTANGGEGAGSPGSPAPDDLGREIRLSEPWVAEAMRGTLRPSDSGREFTGVSIDTRTLARGELFVAIRGERFDGGEFAGGAIDLGAGGVVVEPAHARRLADVQTGHPSVALIEVDDAVAALQRLARAVRRTAGTKVVAITGSAGKTTTKEMAGEILAARYKVVRNRGNLNNHIGLPLSLIELRKRPDVAVVELGMNHAGEISTLVGIAEPEIRVWTNVGEAHLGFFASVDAIADAKAEIFEGASAGTVLVANAEDERIVRRLSRFGGRVVTFGVDREADVQATAVSSRGVDGTDVRVATPIGTMEVALPLVGRGNVANLLAATAIALEFDIPLASIADTAGRFTPAAHRGEILRLRQGVTVVDDSYNANPTATRQALALLTESAGSRRVAMLGEMLELGASAAALHEEVGRSAGGARVDLLIAVGGAPARALADAAIRAGVPAAGVHYVTSSQEAADLAAALVRPGDVVLVKGSRGIRMDRVVDRLKAELA